MTLSIKVQIYDQIKTILEAKASAAKLAIASAKESRDNDTKGSAGDKYETGRAMMQMEMDKSEMQLSKALSQISELSKIDLNRQYQKVEFGSLVLSSQGNYFISIGIGKIEVENTIYYAISLASPIGALLNKKSIGSVVSFQGKEITIKDIL